MANYDYMTEGDRRSSLRSLGSLTPEWVEVKNDAGEVVRVDLSSAGRMVGYVQAATPSNTWSAYMTGRESAIIRRQTLHDCKMALLAAMKGERA